MTTHTQRALTQGFVERQRICHCPDVTALTDAPEIWKAIYISNAFIIMTHGVALFFLHADWILTLNWFCFLREHKIFCLILWSVDTLMGWKMKVKWAAFTVAVYCLPHLFEWTTQLVKLYATIQTWEVFQSKQALDAATNNQRSEWQRWNEKAKALFVQEIKRTQKQLNECTFLNINLCNVFSLLRSCHTEGLDTPIIHFSPLSLKKKKRIIVSVDFF